jgi:predicted AAA+ superfamily ATPase
MKRKLSSLLRHWHSSNARKPLVLRGARQVGKSTLVRLFAEEQGLDLLEVNLERHRDMDRIFAGLDVGLILANLEAVAGKRVGAQTLIFLDEIQAAPHALEALRYFFEDRPELPVVAAGSLLEFALSREAFSMPVGRVQYLFLQPMGFREFLEVVDPPSLEWLESMDQSELFPQEAHKRLSARQREFLLVGGMPEAVKCFAETRDFAAVASIQNGILNTYVDDFSKYARQSDLADLQRLFRNLPLNLGKKTKYTHLLPDASSAHSRKLLELLIKAQVALPIYGSDCSGIPLRGGMNPKVLKLFFLDVGLVSRLLGQDWIDIQSQEERSLVNEGPLAEQFIAQHLYLDPSFETPPELFYWLNESKNANAEVDFVVSQGNLIMPVEVKAGKSGSLKSLHLFCGLRHLGQAVRFDLSPPSRQEIRTSVMGKMGSNLESRYILHSMPLYAFEKLPELLKKIRLERKQGPTH